MPKLTLDDYERNAFVRHVAGPGARLGAVIAL
jgi:hypothetical protein